ncbi:uncharacterized protein LOC110755644 [Prunus avium]|uniref:Uncharacterized protein LOC110755644 n=1 Tax=Prunus avium TaxID=42229 RepID=A0A6P5SFH3_PRUAV|nr:uncharacterized protein LOC110755644 [Prunus avium]
MSTVHALQYQPPISSSPSREKPDFSGFLSLHRAYSISIGDFVAVRCPISVKLVTKVSYRCPLPNPAHFPAQKPKDSQLERLEVSAIFEVSDVVSGDSGHRFCRVSGADFLSLAFIQLSSFLSQLETLMLNINGDYSCAFPVPTLPNLKRLELIVPADDQWALNNLTSFLKASPSLQRLVLTIARYSLKGYEFADERLLYV